MKYRRPHLRTAKRAVAFALLTVIAALPWAAHAEPVRCQRAILKASEKFVLAEMRTLARCEASKLKSALPSSTVTCSAKLARMSVAGSRGCSCALKRGPARFSASIR